MTPKLFAKYWQENYPNCPPVGYLLREVYPSTWFRIHTLPFSKRYAENKKEEQEILRRHNLILSDLLTENGSYILVITGYSSTLSPVQSYPQINYLAESSRYLFSIPKHELEMNDEPYYWHFFILERIWEKHSVDNLLKLIADDEVKNVLFVNTDQNSIYHPYDGGADIFVKDKLKRSSLKEMYSTWLSQHPSGL